jgi:hypothetical protein
MIKDMIPDQLLMEWFTKSLLPPITKDATMAWEDFKDQAILHARHLDMISSQSGTLYDIIPHTPSLSTHPHRTNLEPHANGVVGFVSSAFVCQLVGKLGQMHI